MIDFHSHVLPNVDDGSRSPAESEKMLRMSFAQGVDVMVASPHFYPERQKITGFLAERRRARERIAADPVQMPQILLGAEVAYYDGLSRSDHIQKLCIEGSSLLLVEMPFAPWTSRMMTELCALPKRRGITPVLAHIERYFAFFPHRHILQELQEAGIYFQSNAEFFLLGWKSFRAMKLLKDGCIHFLGSDCHGAERRAPNLDAAAKKISEKGGDRFLWEMDVLGRQLLQLEEAGTVG